VRLSASLSIERCMHKRYVRNEVERRSTACVKVGVEAIFIQKINRLTHIEYLNITFIKIRQAGIKLKIV
jgi:hypothetical protein